MRQFDGHQLRLVVFPGSQQGTDDLQRARTPSLAALQAYAFTVPLDDVCPGIRRLGGPHAPDAVADLLGGTAFGEDRQGVGMAFIKFGQAQITTCDPRQGPPALQGAALAGQRKHIELFALQGLHQFY